ncbi:hypothetical protein REH65_32380 [Saccharopolyspora sp. ID03-671]|uniref:hypothetical protein n=1 Tax=Saccharopolyspora sp. ID03-671 TaxID=3073066 RepID=UPI0032471474
MRLQLVIVYARLCGAAGLGVLLGSAATGLLNLLTGAVFTSEPDWPAGVPVLTLLGTLVGLASGPLTRRWFAPATPRRRLVFTVGGAVAVPLATAVHTGSIALAFLLILASAAATTTLWIREFRRETAQARALFFGSRRPR